MEFSSDSEGGPKMGPAGEQTEEEKEAIDAYMAYIENERGMIRFMIYRKWYEYWYLEGYNVGCVGPMVIASILPHEEIGPNDHREDASHFIFRKSHLMTNTVFSK